ncbi:cyclopropane-fatty-acyl-phospholipid synthase [Fomitopsis betulina]|nr:cyclopropane-fatty-acyl-phospholipid synthase [Fomitopsis betulina]
MSMHTPTLWARLFNQSARSNWIWKQFVSYSRSHVMSVLEAGIKRGQLLIEDHEGKHAFGEAECSRPVTMTIRCDDVWARVVLSLDMGLSEAYMSGDFDVSSLKDMFDLWIDNRHTLTGLITLLNTITSYMSAFAIFALGKQKPSMALKNVQEAYDTSNEFFQCFLSSEMMYSCAIWSDAEGGIRGDLTARGSQPDDLHNAQLRKIHHILANARVKPGYRLLEVGTGWGAMAIEAAKLGASVDSVTLSVQQKAVAERRAAEAGVADRVRVHLLDYRELPADFQGQFDSFVSCEMVEAVGLRDHHTYFKVIDWALKPDRGAACITATAMPEFRYTTLQPDDFARHYHWPNTFLPNATYFPMAAQQAVPGRLILHSVEDHAMHYPRTLREWGYRFEENFKGAIVENLIKEHPQLSDPKSLEAFRRKWHYMFEYAAAGYAKAYTALNCWSFARPEYPVDCCD